ncbi:MAG: DUF6056 family protein [Lachnospiraceae bacterium]|jgi:hypothetical protein|nr:DUF6056 family protein [Lachnospiraceae bacterium]
MKTKSLKRSLANIDISKPFLLIVICVFVKMLTLNFLTPFISDDFAFARATSVIDAAKIEYQHYFEWGGRSIVQFLARVNLLSPKAVFNVLNTLMYVIMSLLIYKMASLKGYRHVPLYLFIVFAIWLYTPVYGQVVLWLVGSSIFLWGMVFTLLFLLPYHKYIFRENSINTEVSDTSAPISTRRDILYMIGMCLLGLIAGWGSHNTSGGMLLLVVAYIVYCHTAKLKIAKWMISGMIGNIIGFLLVVLAPGNQIRALNFIDERPWAVKIADRTVTYTNVIRDDFTPLIIIFIVLVTLQIIFVREKRRTFIAFAYFVASIATIYAMVLSPSTETGRSLFGATIFLIIACVIPFSSLPLKIPSYRAAITIFIATLFFMFTTTFIVAFIDITATWRVSVERTRYIENEIADGNMNIVLPNRMIKDAHVKWNPQHGLDNFGYDENHHRYWVNQSFIGLHGLESLRVERD